MRVKTYRDLLVWQRAMEFIKEVYLLSRYFPEDERPCLALHLRKAAIFLAANIAEGSGRFTSRDLLNFLSQSRGSVWEQNLTS